MSFVLIATGRNKWLFVTFLIGIWQVSQRVRNIVLNLLLRIAMNEICNDYMYFLAMMTYKSYCIK